MAAGDRQTSPRRAPQRPAGALTTEPDLTGQGTARTTVSMEKHLRVVSERDTLEGEKRQSQVDTDEYNGRGGLHRFLHKAPRA